MIHRRWAKFVVGAFVLSVLGFAGAQQRIISDHLNVQDRVTSTTDTIAMGVSYEFVNSVSIDTPEVGGLKIQGADVFDSTDGGSISYSFADDETEMFAEIVEVDGAAYSSTDNNLDAWWSDGNNYLEFGIGPSDLVSADDFNRLDNADIARLFPATESVNDAQQTVGPVLLDSFGLSGKVFVFDAESDETTEELNDGAGGQRSESFRYYIVQRGDGPRNGFNTDRQEAGAGPMSVTVEFTVAPKQ